MWVRSQNKEILIDVKKILIRNDLICYKSKYCIVNTNYSKIILLGVYSTKEKAMSVLDDLQCRIARTESGVYQMPEDEE